MNLSGERVLVTGGAGVIAREVLERLGEAGANVLSVDRLPLAFEPPVGVRHRTADLALADLGELADFRPSIVLHLAATFERSAESAEFWEQNWSDNVIVTHRLAELFGRTRSVQSFVFASSYLAYATNQYLFAEPAPDGVALSESDAIVPRNLCGAAKLYGEAEIAFATGVMGGGFRSVAARIFRVYGRGSRDIVSRWIRAALGGVPVDVYNAENRFDYIYSGDVAEGLIRLAFTPGAEGVVNLGSGRSRTISEVRQIVESATERPLASTVIDTDEPYEASRADLRRLEAMLGWAPPTTLEDGIARVVAFESQVPRGV